MLKYKRSTDLKSTQAVNYQVSVKLHQIKWTDMDDFQAAGLNKAQDKY